MTTQPGGQPVVIPLSVPPKFETLKVKGTKPQLIDTKLLANDPTPAAS